MIRTYYWRTLGIHNWPVDHQRPGLLARRAFIYHYYQYLQVLRYVLYLLFGSTRLSICISIPEVNQFVCRFCLRLCPTAQMSFLTTRQEDEDDDFGVDWVIQYDLENTGK